MEDFSALLIAARERLGITQAQLAISAGLTPSYVSLLENRKKPPPSDAVCERLAAVLKIPARELLEIAHLQRSPATVQKRVRTLRGKLSRERRSRQRVLESLLSPFLFADAPSWIESATGWLGGSAIRKRRLRDVLAALGRRRQDQAAAVSRLVDELPERDRRLLLDALPRLLSERDRAGGGVRPPSPRLFYTLPPRGELPKTPYLLAWSGSSAGELRQGDELLVDPDLEARDGDIVLLRGPDGAPLARRLVRTASGDRLAHLDASPDGARPVEGIAGAPEEEGARERLARDGAGVVVQVRRPLRQRPA